MEIEKAKQIRRAWEQALKECISKATEELTSHGLIVQQFQIDTIETTNGGIRVTNVRIHVEV